MTHGTNHETDHPLSHQQIEHASRKLKGAVQALKRVQKDQGAIREIESVSRLAENALAGDKKAVSQLETVAPELLEDAKQKVTYALEEHQRMDDESPAPTPHRAEEIIHHYEEAARKLTQAMPELGCEEEEKKH